MARPSRVFGYRLCRDLGILDVDGALDSMSGPALLEWQAFYALERDAEEEAYKRAKEER